MPNWITITGDDIRLLDTEKTIMEGTTPLQDLDSCVTSSCHQCRSYIAGGGNTLEPAPAIPPEVKDDAIAIARATYLTHDPTGTLLTSIRQKEWDNALAHLRDIAKGIAAITQAELPPGGDFAAGQWGSAPRIAMLSEDTVAELPPP